MALRDFRAQRLQTELCVCRGGFAGIIAAIAAAREGGLVDEVLLENLHRNLEGNPFIMDAILLEKVHDEPNIRRLLSTAPVACVKDGARIDRIRGFSSQTLLMFTVDDQQFIHYTGDGTPCFPGGSAVRYRG